MEDKKEDGVGTLKKDRTLLLRDERKMEKLKAKLHTDDDCECRLAKAFRSVVDILMAFYPFIFFKLMSLTQQHHLDAMCHSVLIHIMDISTFHEINTQKTILTFLNMQIYMTHPPPLSEN